MPVEKSDNTRVVKSPIAISSFEEQQKIDERKRQKALRSNPDQLWGTNQLRYFENLQNFYNNNIWFNGLSYQTNIDPHTVEGQVAIQSNFDYAKQNAQNFAEQLAVAGIGEGIGQTVRWATTPVETGRGAEAVVRSAPVSTRVTKVTTIPRKEMHLRNQVPGALKADYVSTSNGMTTYTQNKVKILSADQLKKVTKSIEKLMKGKGWERVIHPNLEGLGFTNGQYVVSDIGVGNVGRDILGRPRLVDFVIETVPEFRLAMQKQGGILNNIS